MAFEKLAIGFSFEENKPNKKSYDFSVGKNSLIYH
jgi:hypothetical protein